MKFGEKMRLRRKELNISQADAAEKIGVSRRTYIDWETKDVTPRKQDVYKRISEVFGVSITWLTNDVLEYTPVSYDGMSVKKRLRLNVRAFSFFIQNGLSVLSCLKLRLER